MVTLNKSEIGNNIEKGYANVFTLEGLLKDQLRYFQMEKELHERKYTGEDIQKEEKLKLNKMKRNLDRRKVDVLDKHIFRSMVNLIIFFKYLEEHKNLRNVFEEDVKELLGFIGKNAKYEDNIITRLLQSILKWDIRDPRDSNNFRLELISSIQNVIYNKMLDLTSMDKNLGDSITTTIVNPDFGRALIWSRMFSAKYSQSDQKKKDQAREPNRTINF
jgi:hypothetical protein